MSYLGYTIWVWYYPSINSIPSSWRSVCQCPGHRDSIPGRVMPKTQKWYLKPLCLTLSHIIYGSRVKWGNPGMGVELSPIPWCRSYQNGSLQVTLDYAHQLYWTSPGDNTPQDTNYTDTCLQSRKLYKLDGPDTQDTAGEARTSS